MSRRPIVQVGDALESHGEIEEDQRRAAFMLDA